MATFTKLKSLLGDIRAQHDGLVAKREKALQKREDIVFLPLPKNDFIAMIEEQIDGAGSEYKERLQHQVNQSHEARNIVKKSKFPYPILNPWAGAGDHNKPFASMLRDTVYFYFGEQIKIGMTKSIMSLEWPEKVGLPLSERAAAIDKVDKEIEKIESDLEELISIARKSGITLTSYGIAESGKKSLPGQRASK